MVVQQPQQQQPQQPMPGATMGGMRPQVAAGNGPQMGVGGVGGISAQQLQSIMQRIKSNNPGEGGGQQHLLQWLKSNPQVMAAIIKQRQAQAQGQPQNCGQQQQQVNGPQQQPQQNVMQQQQQGNMVPGSQLQQLMSQQPQQNQGQQQQHPNQVVMGGQAGPHNRVPNVMQNTMQMQQQVGGNMQQQQGPVSIF